jgi:hypothetical protein
MPAVKFGFCIAVVISDPALDAKRIPDKDAMR